jgi:hypothetical protein
MSNRRKNSDTSGGLYLALAAAGAIAYFVLRSRTSKPTDTASSEQNSAAALDADALNTSYVQYRETVASPDFISASFGTNLDISRYTEVPYDRALQIQKNLRHFTIPEVHDYLPLDGVYGFDTDFFFKCFVYWCISAIQLKVEDQALDPTESLGSFELLGDDGMFANGGLECALNNLLEATETGFEPWRIIFRCPSSNAIYFRYEDTGFTLLRSAYEYFSTNNIAEFNCNPSTRTGEMPWNSSNPSDGCNYTVADRKYMQLARTEDLRMFGFIT